MTNEQFADMMWREYGGESFTPTVEYYQEGDCLEFVARSDDYRAERIDGLVTVYYSRITGEIVGSLIKNVSRLEQELSNLPGFMIEVQKGKIRLQHLFLAKSWTSKDPVLIKTYRALADVADQSSAEATLCV